jgi:hypothetical protein
MCEVLFENSTEPSTYLQKCPLPLPHGRGSELASEPRALASGTVRQLPQVGTTLSETAVCDAPPIKEDIAENQLQEVRNV